jgi:Xaa-Pro aminopeptidase
MVGTADSADTIGLVPDVLIFADTARSPELRHEVPLAAPDPMAYLERDGRRRVYASSLEIPRLRELDDLVAVAAEELGLDELIEAGYDWHDIDRELVLRACRHFGTQGVVVSRAFPLDAADHLRANGIQVTADGAFFDRRRRQKTEPELAGIRRALRASEQAYDRVREILRSGREVTSEDLRAEITRTFTDARVAIPDIVIVSHGPQTAIGHEPGHGRIERGEPIVVDLFPQDPESGCYSDMTRTFCVGEPAEELVKMHRLCLEALELVREHVRAGVSGAELHRLACGVFEREGYPTQLSKEPGEVLEEGFYHSLGHGVGLEVHELPSLGRAGDELLAGDVIAVEPGCYRKALGGCSLEDLLLVTEDGCERLTDYPYDLAP